MKKQGVIFFLFSIISLVSLFVLRFILGGWVDYLWVPLVFFIIFGISGAWTLRQFLREFMSVKTTKEGLSMGALILMTLALLVAINYLGAKKYKTFDFSSAQINSLSDQTKKLLKTLTSDLKVTYFYKQGEAGVEDNRRGFVDLIKRYQDESSQVKLEFVEVNENPKLAEEYGVNKGSGLVFVDYKGRRNKIEKIDEQELTGALVKVTREKDKKIYFVMGHRERDFEDASQSTGLNAFKKLLEGNRYLVLPLNLKTVPEVPTDADMVMIAGPEQAYLDDEIKSLENYLKRGGNMFVALDAKTGSGLDSLFERLGLKMGNLVIVQAMQTALGQAINPAVTPVSQFSPNSVITQPFARGEFVRMRLPFPLNKTTPPANITIEDLAQTDQTTLGFPDTNFKGASQPGPFTVAVQMSGFYPGAPAAKPEEKAGHFNVVLFGDADFLSNQLLYQNLNRDLALNSIAFLAREENVISITPKEVNVTQMQISEMQFQLFIFGFIIPLPLILVMVSGWLWYRRRYA
jgi:ABC-type uncharacterized transport system involved in gliding motility auxiliary subunit